jgi:hypothetical protein
VAARGGSRGGDELSAWFDPERRSTAFPLRPDDMLAYQGQRLRQFMHEYQEKRGEWAAREQQKVAQQRQWDLEQEATGKEQHQEEDEEEIIVWQGGAKAVPPPAAAAAAAAALPSHALPSMGL